MIKLSVNKRGVTYLPEELRNEGYVGEISVVVNAAAAVMEKPGATPQDIIKSLEILKQHYELLQEMGKREEE